MLKYPFATFIATTTAIPPTLKHLPNILTWLRLLSAPVLVVIFTLLPEQWRDSITALFFAVITLTDWLDGYLARRFNLATRFGQFLDPVADKIIVITALLLLQEAERAHLLAVLIIICREICVLGLREWMAEIGKVKLITPSLIGKSKTAFQMVAIVLMFYQQDIAGLSALAIGQVLLWIAAVLTVVSMIYYLRAAAKATAETKTDQTNQTD